MNVEMPKQRSARADRYYDEKLRTPPPKKGRISLIAEGARPARQSLGKTTLIVTGFAAIALGFPQISPVAARSVTVFLGAGSDQGEPGLFTAQLDLQTGELSRPQPAAALSSAGFLAIAPSGRHLYAVGRGSRDTPAQHGRIAALEIDGQSAQLRLINEMPTQGAGPCHVSLDVAGEYALVASYGSGSVEVFQIGADGRIQERTAFAQHSGSSVNADRQTAPHAHSIHLDPSQQFALAPDLGIDRVVVHHFDASNGSLKPHEESGGSVKPGSGPRHLAWHPDGDRVFVLNELLATVSALEFDGQRGTLSEYQTISALPRDYEGVRAASEIQVHPAGEFVYAANRGHDSIALLRVDPTDGRLTFVETVSCGGQWPRHFGIDPTGKYLITANQKSNNVSVLRIDPATGRLESTGFEQPLANPMCVKYLAQR